jgi:tetratricopeptide (TPR) repeat protein
LLLGALALVSYTNALDAPFVFDDGVAIERNLQIRALWPPSVPLSPPRDTPVAGRPVVNASLALNYALSGLEPRGYRITNLALHAACAWLLFALVRRTLRRLGAASADGVALAAAALFAVHPLASEVVDYTSQRSESLMALFTLLVLMGVARAAGAASPGEERTGRWLAWSACALGMATKESMVAAPLLALLYDRAYFAGSLASAWQRRRALHLGLAACWAILLLLHASAPRGLSVGLSHGVTPATYLANQMVMLTTYLARALWPHPLLVDYGWPQALAWSDVWPQALLVALWAGGAAWLAWRRPQLGFPLVAGLLVLAPSSSLVPIVTEVGAERRFYLPLAGLLALACALAAAWLARRPSLARRVAAAACALCVALLLLATRARNEDYASEERLWRSVLALRPEQPRALLSLGQALREQGRRSEAEPLVRAALRASPGYALAEAQLALLAEDAGDLDTAELHLRRALALEPVSGELRTNLGELLVRRGRAPEAIAEWQRALAGNPELAYAANNLAWVRATHPDARLRDGAEAVALAERAARTTAWLDAGVLDTLGAAYAEAGRFDAARAAAERARARALADGDAALAGAVAERLVQYGQGRPIRVVPAVEGGSGAPGSEAISSGGSGA